MRARSISSRLSISASRSAWTRAISSCSSDWRRSTLAASTARSRWTSAVSMDAWAVSWARRTRPPRPRVRPSSTPVRRHASPPPPPPHACAGCRSPRGSAGSQCVPVPASTRQRSAPARHFRAARFRRPRSPCRAQSPRPGGELRLDPLGCNALLARNPGSIDSPAGRDLGGLDGLLPLDLQVRECAGPRQCATPRFWPPARSADARSISRAEISASSSPC